MDIKTKSSIAPAAVALAIATLLPSANSFAAPDNAADVFKDSYCVDYQGSTICYSSMAITKQTVTPSGNVLFFGNGKSSYLRTDPSGAVYQDSLSYHTQGVDKDSLLKEYGQFFTTTLSVNGNVCTSKYSFHMVDGKIQFERLNTCIP